MNQAINDMAYAYTQLGFMGLFCIVVLVLVIWWFTKGRKQQVEEREKLIREQARVSTVIENCTAVINNNTRVIEANTQARLDVKEDFSRFNERMVRHGGQLDEILANQRVCLDRQARDK